MSYRKDITHFCKIIGKSESYLATMKSQNSKRYRYYKALGKGDAMLGMQKYETISHNLRNKMIDIAYEKSSIGFSKWLAHHKLFKNERTAYNFVYATIYKTETVKINLLVKLRAIYKLYEKEKKIKSKKG